MEAGVERRRIRVRGTVQGVGFRPFVYGLANSAGLTGFVLNDAAGVVIEVEGLSAAVVGFIEGLSPEAPAMSAIDNIEEETIPLCGSISFEIRTSTWGRFVRRRMGGPHVSGHPGPDHGDDR
jgi:hydrogenase maturation protein HypF